MDVTLVLALGLAIVFAGTNGVHDAANAIAALVATRAATPARAIALATVCNLAGPFVLGAAVADTVGGIVRAEPTTALTAIAAGLAAAVAWNVATWRVGLPSSSGHALVGGLVGAALAAGGADAVHWGGFDGIRPVGVLGTLAVLAAGPLAGALVALVVTRAIRHLSRRATRRWRRPVEQGEWLMSAWLAFSHGANDAQKAIGVVAAVLLADGRIETLDPPAWAVVVCAVALTAGTALGGWRIIRTVGRGIYRLRPVEGLAAQSSSAAVLFSSSLAGAPMSTSQVVASSIVGVGAGRRQWHHVHWSVVRQMGLAWLVTIPVTAVVGAAASALWRTVA